MNGQLILGVDIGGTKTAVLLGTLRGEIRHRTELPTGSDRGFAAAYQDIVTGIETTMRSVPADVVALSVSIGGPLDVLQGVILSPPNLPGWDRIPLKQLLADRFRLPVYIEHDGNAGALAEYYFGAGRGARNIVFLTMGTGFGAGLILDGRLYRGTSDVAGEIGHIRIAEDGPDCYGKPGSMEGFASGTGIARLARMMFPGRWPQTITVKDLYADYQAGAEEARVVFSRAAQAFGRGLAMIADMLNPERIILGGLGMRLQDVLVEPALAIFAAEALPRALSVCSVVPASLGEDIGDYAALVAAYDQGRLLEVHAGGA
jgi:glucokinase